MLSKQKYLQIYLEWHYCIKENHMLLLKLKILSNLGQGGTEFLGMGTNIGTITGIFDAYKMIPPYFLQVAIGFYIIEVIFILTSTLVTVDVGEDKLKKMHAATAAVLPGALNADCWAFNIKRPRPCVQHTNNTNSTESLPKSCMLTP